MNESAIIQRAKAGCHEALTDLVHTYYRPVIKQCMSLMGEPMEAEDLAQDVFLDALVGLPYFRGDAKLSTWLHRIAANKAYKRARELSKYCLGPDDTFGSVRDESSTIAQPDPGIETDPELRCMLHQLIEALPPLLRRTIRLRLMGYKYTEIAAMHNCPPETVKTRVRRAISLMREEGVNELQSA
jgi:RNA polymerase sigma-70 factor (ECF subfamily)